MAEAKGQKFTQRLQKATGAFTGTSRVQGLLKPMAEAKSQKFTQDTELTVELIRAYIG